MVRVYRDANGARSELEGFALLVERVRTVGPPWRPLEDWYVAFEDPCGDLQLPPVRRLVHPGDRVPEGLR